MQTIESLVKKNRELFWDIKNISNIDELAVEERFLKYGNWENIKSINKILGKKKAKNNYIKIRDKDRSNLSEKTINYFNLYFNV